MTNPRQLGVLTFTLLMTLGAYAQNIALTPIGSQPRSLPAASPVLSESIDDIPPTATLVATAGGSLVAAKANFMLTYMDLSPLEQRVWFTLSADAVPANVYYNERKRATVDAPWYWTYSSSPPVLTITENPGFTGPPSFALGTVLYSPSAQFRHPNTWVRYPWAMYAIYQSSQCNGLTAGFLVVSFSNDGKQWIGPFQMVRYGGPSFGCWANHYQTVPVEAASAIYDGNGTVYFMGVEGDGALLVDRQNMDRTLTVVGYTDVDNPGLVQLAATGGSEVTANGVVKPNVLPAWGTRYQAYAYFINLQMAWDAASGYLYVSRAYPFGFDRGSAGLDYPDWFLSPHPSVVYNSKLYNYTLGEHQRVDGCDGSPATGPTRVQIYKMYLGSLANFLSATTTQAWTLITDVGTDRGYKMMRAPDDPTIFQPAIQPALGMVNTGRDLGSGSFVTDPYGHLKRYGTSAYWLAGADIRAARTVGSGTCACTGDEKVVLHTLTP